MGISKNGFKDNKEIIRIKEILYYINYSFKWLFIWENMIYLSAYLLL